MKNLIERIEESLESAGFPILEGRLKPMKTKELVKFLKSIGFKENQDFNIVGNDVNAKNFQIAQDIADHEDIIMGNMSIIIDDDDSNGIPTYKITILK